MEITLGDIWFILWGVLWAIYFVLDGFDFGVGMWIPIFGLSGERDRQAMYKAIGPVWDANEVWLVTAGGVTFAAFPLAYATIFSSFYSPLMILLFVLILRGVSLEFRAQWTNHLWRRIWDFTMAGTGFLAPFLLGVFFSNIFWGIPVNAEHVMEGNFLTFVWHPFALLGGLLFVVMFALHGSLYLGFKVDGDLKRKADFVSMFVWPVFILLFLLYVVLFLAWAGLYKNFFAMPILLIIPVICLAGFFMSAYQLYFKRNSFKAFLYSSLGIFFFTITGIVGIYPNLLPSTLNPEWSINIANSASSPKTLTIMLVVVLIFVPIVIIYQYWAHKLFNQVIETK